jgi:hypothetical protein
MYSVYTVKNGETTFNYDAVESSQKTFYIQRPIDASTSLCWTLTDYIKSAETELIL